MPKKRHHWKPTTHPNNIRGRLPVGGPPAVVGVRRPVSRSLEPPLHRASHSSPAEMQIHPPKNAVAVVPDLTLMASDQAPLQGTGSTDFGWTAEPADDHMLSYAVEGTPDSYSRDRSPPRGPLSKTGEASWNSSLSSLSLDSSLNSKPTAEESALLQECIAAALPKSRGGGGGAAGGKRSGRKSAGHHHQPLRTSPSGSSESSLKRPAVANVVAPVPSGGDPMTDPDVGEPGPDSLEKDSCQDPENCDRRAVFVPDWAAGGGVAAVDSCDDILQEYLPDVGISELTLDDDSLPSGPSTEANNTVIYCGPTLPESSQSPVAAEPAKEVEVAARSAEPEVAELMENIDIVIADVLNDLAEVDVERSNDAGPTATELFPDQVTL